MSKKVLVIVELLLSCFFAFLSNVCFEKYNTYSGLLMMSTSLLSFPLFFIRKTFLKHFTHSGIIWLDSIGFLLSVLSTKFRLCSYLGLLFYYAILQTVLNEKKGNNTPVEQNRYKEESDDLSADCELPVSIDKTMIKDILDKLPNNCVVDDLAKKRKRCQDEKYFEFESVNKRSNVNKLKSFVAVDIETTGLSPTKNRICQLSAIKFIDGVPYEVFDTYVDPHFGYDYPAAEIHKIPEDVLRNSPNFSKIIDSFESFIEDYPLVFYNASFDVKFLYCSGAQIENHKIYDAYKLSNKAFEEGKLKNHKLITVARQLGITYAAHNSLQDCYVTGIVFLEEINAIKTGVKL